MLDVGSLCTARRAIDVSPIDEFYGHLRSSLMKAGEPVVAGDEVLLRLLVLEVVSAAELYFRRVLSSSINVCFLVREKASRRTLTLGAVDYYSKDLLGFGLLEHVSLSGNDEIRKQTQNITGFEIRATGSVGVALEDFEKICQLRHAIVHARGALAAQNVAQLKIQRDEVCIVNVTAASFQAVSARVNNAVRAYNKFLFESILSTWVRAKALVGDWGRDRAAFTALYKLFYSRTDGVGPRNPWQAYRSMVKTLK